LFDFNRLHSMRFSRTRLAICTSLYFILMLPLANGQSTIKGLITDFSTGEPIPAATIYIPQTKFFTETDLKGRYSLSFDANLNGLLKIQKLGYETLEFDLKNISTAERQEFNLKLKPYFSRGHRKRSSQKR